MLTCAASHGGSFGLVAPSCLLMQRCCWPQGAFKIYLDDLYHTLLNMPRYRFLMSFFSVYFLLYLAFAFIVRASVVCPSSIAAGLCVSLQSSNWQSGAVSIPVRFWTYSTRSSAASQRCPEAG